MKAFEKLEESKRDFVEEFLFEVSAIQKGDLSFGLVITYMTIMIVELKSFNDKMEFFIVQVELYRMMIFLVFV